MATLAFRSSFVSLALYVRAISCASSSESAQGVVGGLTSVETLGVSSPVPLGLSNVPSDPPIVLTSPIVTEITGGDGSVATKTSVVQITEPLSQVPKVVTTLSPVTNTQTGEGSALVTVVSSIPIEQTITPGHSTTPSEVEQSNTAAGSGANPTGEASDPSSTNGNGSPSQKPSGSEVASGTEGNGVAPPSSSDAVSAGETSSDGDKGSGASLQGTSPVSGSPSSSQDVGAGPPPTGTITSTGSTSLLPITAYPTPMGPPPTTAAITVLYITASDGKSTTSAVWTPRYVDVPQKSKTTSSSSSTTSGSPPPPPPGGDDGDDGGGGGSGTVKTWACASGYCPPSCKIPLVCTWSFSCCGFSFPPIPPGAGGPMPGAGGDDPDYPKSEEPTAFSSCSSVTATVCSQSVNVFTPSGASTLTTVTDKSCDVTLGCDVAGETTFETSTATGKCQPLTLEKPISQQPVFSRTTADLKSYVTTTAPPPTPPPPPGTAAPILTTEYITDWDTSEQLAKITGVCLAAATHFKNGDCLVCPTGYSASCDGPIEGQNPTDVKCICQKPLGIITMVATNPPPGQEVAWSTVTQTVDLDACMSTSSACPCPDGQLMHCEQDGYSGKNVCECRVALGTATIFS